MQRPWAPVSGYAYKWGKIAFLNDLTAALKWSLVKSSWWHSYKNLLSNGSAFQRRLRSLDILVLNRFWLEYMGEGHASDSTQERNHGSLPLDVKVWTPGAEHWQPEQPPWWVFLQLYQRDHLRCFMQTLKSYAQSSPCLLRCFRINCIL